MTPESQRIAIAEACPNVCHINKALNQAFWNDSSKGDDFDPLNDLNAMHEAEKVLVSDEQYRIFEAWLWRLSSTWHAGKHPRAYSSTATQRAEAFLRTLGLWKGDASHLSTVASRTAFLKPK